MKSLVKKSPFFWCYLIAGLVFLAFGGMTAPVWEGQDVFFGELGAWTLTVSLCLCLLLYVVFFSLPSFFRETGKSARLILSFEIVALFVIGILCVLDRCGLSGGWIPRVGVAVMLGAVIWVRGVSLSLLSLLKERRAFYALFTSGLITLGTYFVCHPLASETELQWAVAVILAVFGFISFVGGLMKMPPRPPREKKKKEAKKKEKKKSPPIDKA